MARPKFIPGSTAVFQVKNRSGKKLLATYLASRLGVVEGWAIDLLERGCVRLDGEAATAETLVNLSAGPHDIEVRFPLVWPRHMGGTPMDLDILHEDDCLVVLNKPPGVVVHPARGHLDGQTLQNGMRHRYQHLVGREGVTIGSPHRLDKDTSGALAFALTTDTYVELVRQFSASEPHKEYLAILDGEAGFAETVCEQPLGNDPDHKGRGKVLSLADGGKAARTDFTVLERGAGWTLARARPHTGRPHQIRIHAAALGLPLAGDGEYNSDPARLGLKRQALHAAALAFRHPATGAALRVEAPLAPDLEDALRRLRQM